MRNLHKEFESVTLEIERLEIKKESLIEHDKDTSHLEDRIYTLEDRQYEIQLEIEELE